MKVLFFYQYFGTPNGSWSTRVYEFTRRWVAQGHDITVVTAPYDKSDIEPKGFVHQVNIDGIKVIVVNSGDSNRLPKWKRMYRAIRFSLVAMYYASNKDYEIAIASSGPITIGLPLIVAKVIRRKTTVFEVRDLWPTGGIELGLIKAGWQAKISLWFEGICYKNSNRIVTASIGQKQHILARYPELTIEVVPNASDMDLFGKQSYQKLPNFVLGKSLFTHIGSLGLIHNTAYWLEVAAELKKHKDAENIIMVFIGDGADREKLEREKNERMLDNLYFLGLKPKSALPAWVQNSVATLFATTSNPAQNTCSPNKVFDSFAAGVPVLQTSCGWLFDLFADEYCGLNVSLNNPEEAAEKMVWLTKNPEELARMKKNALRLAQSDFNRDILANKYLDILSAAYQAVRPK